MEEVEVVLRSLAERLANYKFSSVSSSCSCFKSGPSFSQQFSDFLSKALKYRKATLYLVRRIEKSDIH
jgi:hypothetical protein